MFIEHFSSVIAQQFKHLLRFSSAFSRSAMSSRAVRKTAGHTTQDDLAHVLQKVGLDKNDDDDSSDLIANNANDRRRNVFEMLADEDEAEADNPAEEQDDDQQEKPSSKSKRKRKGKKKGQKMDQVRDGESLVRRSYSKYLGRG